MELRLRHTCTGHRAALYALAPGPNAGHFYTAGGDGWIVDWNWSDPEIGRVVASVESRIFSLCTLPFEGQLLAGNMDGGLHWIDLQAPERTRNVQHHQKGVFDLLVVGEWLYSLGGDGTLTRWALESRRALESFQLSRQALRCIAYAPLRAEFAIGASDGCIYLLDAETLELRRTMAAAHQPSVFTLQYSPDQQRLFSGGRDAMLRVWDLESPELPVQALPAHLFTLNHLAFSPDGRLLASASRDKTIKIWDADSVELLKVVDALRHDGHVNSVNRLLWLEEGLISAGDDRVLKIWGI